MRDITISNVEINTANIGPMNDVYYIAGDNGGYHFDIYVKPDGFVAIPNHHYACDISRIPYDRANLESIIRETAVPGWTEYDILSITALLMQIAV